jgi:FkbM family methyltransferase
MTPILHIRSFSDDQYWIDKVFYTNSYRMKGVKEREKAPVVIDIGAHCGYFTFTALALGAKKVYAIEPFVENYKILLKNTGETPQVVQLPLAISNHSIPIDFAYPNPTKSHLNLSHIEPTVTSDQKYYTSPSVTLDQLFEFYIQEDVIDILKINIGYQERDILTTSKLLDTKVNSICGETILEPEFVATFKAEMSAKGFVKSHVITSTEETNKIFFIFSKGEIEDYYSL